MNLLTVKSRIILSAVAVVGLTAIYSSEFTNWHNLEAVTLNGAQVEDWSSRYALSPNDPLLRQPLDSLAGQLLADRRIGRVDIGYALPGRLDIKTNQFAPLALVVDESTGLLRGLDLEGRVLPLESDGVNWNVPVLTTVDAQRLFGPCADVRVAVLMPQLKKLADDAPGFFSLISEIDFGPSDFLYVTISGMSYRLKVDSGAFYEQVSSFIQFIEGYSPDLEHATNFDLRFPGIIVREEGKS